MAQLGKPNKLRMDKKKKNGFGGVFRRIVFIIALIMFIYAAWKLVNIYTEYRAGQSEYEELRESFKTEKNIESDKGSETSAQVTIEKSKATITSEKPEVTQAGASVEISAEDSSKASEPIPTYPAKEGPININGVTLDMLLGAKYAFDFDELRRINPEVMAWIQIEGTNIDYPVVQASDNEKYLRQTLTGEWNNAGSIFADYRNVNPFQEQNTIIHGHNQRNHMMFHDLINYENKDYWKDHQYISIYTPDGKCYVYQVYAAYRTGGVSKTYFCNFESDAQYQVYLDYVKSQELYDTGIPVTTANKIITLSTCSNDWEDEGETARMVIHGKLINQ